MPIDLDIRQVQYCFRLLKSCVTNEGKENMCPIKNFSIYETPDMKKKEEIRIL